MAITRYSARMPVFTSSWRELDDLLSNRLGRMMEEGWTNAPTGDWIPAVNVEESKDELVLTAELPGLGPDDVDIELENNILTIKGEKLEETREEKEDTRCHVYERRYGSFLRSFTLPRTVQGDQIDATFRNGILTVHMPKVPEAKGRKISVKSEG